MPRYTEQQIKDTGKPLVLARASVPITKVPVWNPLADRAWREVYAKIDMTRGTLSMGRK